MTDPNYERVRRIALTLLEELEAPTTDDIREKVRTAILAKKLEPGTIDESALTRDIETSLNIWVGGVSALDSNEDHVEWLSDTLSVITEDREQPEWAFWNRYSRYLREIKRWPEPVVKSIDRTSTDVLKRLEDPLREGSWDRRGMVVGNVQSGKTANFTAVICKAADAGYKVIVVLTGMHNSLRSQTQFRLDEEFLGYETDKNLKFDEANSRIGVMKKLIGAPFLRVNSLTSSRDDGDFNSIVARNAGIIPGGDPILLVVKKNASVLKNLNGWARAVRADDEGKIGDVPLLVIDDECDQASINTASLDLADPDYDITAINRQIRKLLHTFKKSAYVGYTATPFATVFIHPDNPHAEYGEDLFPRSFILALAAPSNYVGPAEVFGLQQDEDIGIEARPEQPVIRQVADYSAWIPDKHKKDLAVPPLPATLKEAIRSFILSCAARECRGQAQSHNSMLIHVSRFTDVQKQVAELVTDELARIQGRIRYAENEEEDLVWTELRTLWRSDFEETTRVMTTEADVISWETVRPHVKTAASKITIKTINGTVKDVLDYRNHQETGVSVIAVGGDKLSRGLTLEGLTVSYYLRATKMYDTLMQMGRWFGYRDGFGDLCRIYTTPDLISWYRWIAMASEELRRDFIQMVEVGGTPEDFGLRVRRHPEGLLITSLNKMQAGKKMKLSYADTTAETLVFYSDPKIAEDNLAATERFLGRLRGKERPASDPSHPHSPEGQIWDKVAPDDVTAFLDTYTAHPSAHRAKTQYLSAYIRQQNLQGDLNNWTVALLSSEAVGTARATINGKTVSLFTRTMNDELGDRVNLKRLIAPKNEAADLTRTEYDAALADTKRVWKEKQDAQIGRPPDGAAEPDIPSPSKIRAARPPTRGLLLLYPIEPNGLGFKDMKSPVIGFALSFPPSLNARAIEYVVNPVFESEML